MFEASLKDPDFLFSKTPVLLTEKKKTSSSSQEFASFKIHHHDYIIANSWSVRPNKRQDVCHINH